MFGIVKDRLVVLLDCIMRAAAGTRQQGCGTAARVQQQQVRDKEKSRRSAARVQQEQWHNTAARVQWQQVCGYDLVQ